MNYISVLTLLVGGHSAIVFTTADLETGRRGWELAYRQLWETSTKPQLFLSSSVVANLANNMCRFVLQAVYHRNL